jgi:lambda family phage minor tail protein L
MDKITAQSEIKELYAEAFSLSSSALITLFEIDVSQIGLSAGAISQTEVNAETSTIFRFHNNTKINSTSIIWQGKEYIAAPVNAEGFEITSKGVLPTPKLSINVSNEAVSVFAEFRQRIREIGDLTGAKVTRIRTYARFLDAENFTDGNHPKDFSPNPRREFPRDVFYIDRKSNENKYLLEFELASLLDVQGQKLPGRLVVSNTCPFIYRGDGCFYEYNSRRNIEEHGAVGESNLLTSAPAVANQFDELISPLLSGITIVDKGAYDQYQTYNSGDATYLTFNHVNYYYVANGVDVTVSPPNANYWIPDMCSHKPRGCEIRYALGGTAVGTPLGNLPYGGFLAVSRFK